MTAYQVTFTADAESDLDDIYNHIAASSGTMRADSVVGSLVASCLALELFPHRGKARDDVTPGLRVIAHRRRATIAFTIDGSTVTVEGVFWRGRDLSAVAARLT